MRYFDFHFVKISFEKCLINFFFGDLIKILFGGLIFVNKNNRHFSEIMRGDISTIVEKASDINFSYVSTFLTAIIMKISMS